MCKRDFALYNLKWSICHHIKPPGDLNEGRLSFALPVAYCMFGN